MKDQHELKSLQVRKTKLESEIMTIEDEKNRVVQELGWKRNELNMIKQKIGSFAEKEPVVTEHALLRYIERVMGVDLDSIKDRILTDKNREAIAFAGTCKIKSDGVELIVKDRCVISVVT